MTVQAILVPVYGRQDRGVLTQAGLLAETLSAGVDIVRVDPNLARLPYPSDDAGFGILTSPLAWSEPEPANDGSDFAADLIARFRAAPGGARLRLLADQAAPDALAELSRLSDLIVLPLPSDAARGPGVDFLLDLLRRSGRPILAVPGEADDAAATPERVLIGWDGGLSAARAVAAALPLLKRAGRVTAVAYDRDLAVARSRIAALSAYLAQHGVTVRAAAREADRRPLNVRLLHEMRAEDSDLLVIGAGADGWLRRLFNGGIARSILGRASLPVLLSA